MFGRQLSPRAACLASLARLLLAYATLGSLLAGSSDGIALGCRAEAAEARPQRVVIEGVGREQLLGGASAGVAGPPGGRLRQAMGHGAAPRAAAATAAAAAARPEISLYSKSRRLSSPARTLEPLECGGSANGSRCVTLDAQYYLASAAADDDDGDGGRGEREELRAPVWPNPVADPQDLARLESGRAVFKIDSHEKAQENRKLKPRIGRQASEASKRRAWAQDQQQQQQQPISKSKEEELIEFLAEFYAHKEVLEREVEILVSQWEVLREREAAGSGLSGQVSDSGSGRQTTNSETEAATATTTSSLHQVDRYKSIPGEKILLAWLKSLPLSSVSSGSLRKLALRMLKADHESLMNWLRQRQKGFHTLANTTFELLEEFPNRTINVCKDGPKILILPDGRDILHCYTRDQWIGKLWSDLRLSAYHYPIIVLNILIFLFGTTGNIFVCLSVYRNHQLRNVTNYFIVNLAFADFLVILICLPATAVWDLTLTWFFGTIPCKLIMFLQDVSISVSVLTLTAISLDRYYAICHPLKFKSSLSQAKKVIVLIWIVSLIIMTPDLVYLSANESQELSEAGLDTVLYSDCNYNWGSHSSSVFQFVKTILLYLVPLMLMFCAHFTIMQTLRMASSSCIHELQSMEQASVNTTSSLASSSPSRPRMKCVRTQSQQIIANVPANLTAGAAANLLARHHPLGHSTCKLLHRTALNGSVRHSASEEEPPSDSRPSESDDKSTAQEVANPSNESDENNNNNNNLNSIGGLRQIRFSVQARWPQPPPSSSSSAAASSKVEPPTGSRADQLKCAQNGPKSSNDQKRQAPPAKRRIIELMSRYSFDSSCSPNGLLNTSFRHNSRLLRPTSRVLQQQQQDKAGEDPSGSQLMLTMHNKNHIESRRKAATMLAAIVVIFGICYLPVHLINFLRQFIENIPQTDVTSTISMLSHCACYLNSAINPIIYNHMNSVFRAEFRKFLSCLYFNSKEADEGEHQGSIHRPTMASRSQSEAHIDIEPTLSTRTANCRLSFKGPHDFSTATIQETKRGEVCQEGAKGVCEMAEPNLSSCSSSSFRGSDENGPATVIEIGV